MFQVTVTRNSENGMICVKHAGVSKRIKVVAATCFTSVRPNALALEIRIMPRGQIPHSAKKLNDAVLLCDEDGRLALLATGHKDDKSFFYFNEQTVNATISPWWQIYEEEGQPDTFEVADEIGTSIFTTNPQKVLRELGRNTFWKVRQVVDDKDEMKSVLRWLVHDIDSQGLFDELGCPVAILGILNLSGN